MSSERLVVVKTAGLVCLLEGYRIARGLPTRSALAVRTGVSNATISTLFHLEKHAGVGWRSTEKLFRAFNLTGAQWQEVELVARISRLKYRKRKPISSVEKDAT